uniref:Uncharacterized protein n=1 Tax=Sus scrofa TaxID=9823 RepID=A0A480G6Q0_PIG
MPSEDEDRDHGDNFHKLRNTKDCQHTAISQERDVEQIVPHSPQKIDPADSFILDFQPLQLSIPKKQPHQKMGRRSKQTILQRRHTDGQKSH